MTKGTLAFVGTPTRETDLLLIRLEKEGYHVTRYAASHSVYSRLFKAKPIAIVIAQTTPRQIVTTIIGLAPKGRSSKGRVPIIITAHDQIDPKLAAIKGIGEVWKLHQITLAEVVKRLRFAIQLCQLTL